MKISSKQELQQIAFNHSTDISFKYFMNFYKKCTTKPCFFLIVDATQIILYFSERDFQKKQKKKKKLTMTIEVLIKDEKLQNDINREVANYHNYLVR